MEVGSKDEAALVVIWRFVRGYGAQIATAASAILLALAQFKEFTDARMALIVVGVCLGVVGIVGMLIIRPTYAQLLEERNEAQRNAHTRSELLQQSLTSMLKRLARELELTNTHYRLSLYCHREQHFVMLARHSAHGKWNRAGRVVYAEANDAITDAWNKGWSVFVDLPQDKAKRVTELVEVQGMSREDANGLTMPSRSVVGFRLLEGEEPVGVIVLESTQPRGVHSKTLEALRVSVLAGVVASMMGISRDHFPAMIQHVLPKESPLREQLQVSVTA